MIIVESIRAPNRWIVPFLVVLMAGDETLTMTIKHLADRARPTLNPSRPCSGPPFPAATLRRRRRSMREPRFCWHASSPRMWRSCLAGVAVTAAVGVAASRVLLDVHWLSDVIAGTMLGWGWFAICSIAFGGRLLTRGLCRSS